MGMFDYRQYTSAQSTELLNTAFALAGYAGAQPDSLGIVGLTNFVNDSLPTLYPNHITLTLPTGWRELTPLELSLPSNAVDQWGFYDFGSPFTGDAPDGLQAKIIGQYDASGQLIKVAISFRDTESLNDWINNFLMDTAAIAPYMNTMFNAVKNLTIASGLSAQNVLVTGYSLGGSLANIAAKHRLALADGFFDTANFVGLGALTVWDNPAILNFGYENDVVYRFTDDTHNLTDKLNSGDWLLISRDTEHNNSCDNVVLFDDTYASPLWTGILSFWDRAYSWYAHLDAVVSDAHQRIGTSAFYEFTNRDSVVIVDNLSSLMRGNTWVYDKLNASSNHFGHSAFIIGTQYTDLLQGGLGNDYIYGGAGNDIIRAGLGLDRVDGGSGTKDELRLEGGNNEWNVYRLSDGTQFFDNKNTSDLVQAEHITHVSFVNDWGSYTTPYEVGNSALVDKHFGGWFSGWNININYQTATEGTAANDTLTGRTVFGMDGNDTLTVLGTGSLLHGGEGNDILIDANFNDQLYGAEGNDVLRSTGGVDQLYGGIGDDVFSFNQRTYIADVFDFNQAAGDQDGLLFSNAVFSNQAALNAGMHQVGDDVVINHNFMTVTVHHALLDEVYAHTVIA